MKNIKSICNYSSSYDLIRDYYGRDVFYDAALTDEQEEYLQYVDDYESVTFYVINDDTVLICDSISGDVIGDPVCLEEFKQNMFELAMEEA